MLDIHSLREERFMWFMGSVHGKHKYGRRAQSRKSAHLTVDGKQPQKEKARERKPGTRMHPRRSERR